MSDRTWRDGFHQAVEAKEGVVVTRPKETLDSISFQRFFGMYRRLAGMSGTLSEARRELWSVYSLPVTVIPRHRPSRLRRLPLMAYGRGEDRWQAVAGRRTGHQRRTCRAPGLTMLLGVPRMKFTTLSKALAKYIS